MRAAVTPRGSEGNRHIHDFGPRHGAGPAADVDWDMWQSMASVELWEALSLSVGLNPARWPPPRDTPDEVITDYKRRLRVVESHLGPDGTLQLVSGVGARGNPRVRLPKFASWALSLGWRLPDAYPRAAAEAAELEAEGATGADRVLTVARDDARETGSPQSAASEAIHRLATTAAPLPAPAAPAETHMVKRRADPLAAVLAEAKRKALDQTDWHSVWAALTKLAESADRPPPLLGYVEGEGVQYRVDDAAKPVAYLTREALRGRFRRG